VRSEAFSVVRLAEHLFSVPLTTPVRAETLLGVTRPTAQAAIEELVERGDLIEVTGRGRRRIYEAPRIFEAVYGAVEVPETEHDRQISFDLDADRTVPVAPADRPPDRPAHARVERRPPVRIVPTGWNRSR
jgi:hypothetical protein